MKRVIIAVACVLTLAACGPAEVETAANEAASALPSVPAELAASAEALAEEAEALASSIEALASAGDLDAVIDQSIAILDTVVANADALEEGIRTLPWATSAIARVTAHGNWFQVYARGVGVVNTFLNEPVIGPDYNDTGVDDATAPQPVFGEPRFPTPPIPETGVGPVTVNPSPDTRAREYDESYRTGSSGLAGLFSNLLGGGS